jgi:hypothetical protein
MISRTFFCMSLVQDLGAISRIFYGINIWSSYFGLADQVFLALRKGLIIASPNLLIGRMLTPMNQTAHFHQSYYTHGKGSEHHCLKDTDVYLLQQLLVGISRVVIFAESVLVDKRAQWMDVAEVQENEFIANYLRW